MQILVHAICTYERVEIWNFKSPPPQEYTGNLRVRCMVVVNLLKGWEFSLKDVHNAFNSEWIISNKKIFISQFAFCEKKPTICLRKI